MTDSVFNLDFEKIAGEKLLQLMGERTPTSIALLDRNYNVHYVNDRLASTLAFSKDEICSKRCFELTGKDRPCPGCMMAKVFESGEKVVSMRRQTRKDGSAVVLEIHDVPVKKNGRVEKVIEFLVDKTRILEYRDRLEQDFLSLIDILAQLLDSKDAYTARHSRCVRDVSLALARKLGMPREEEFRMEVAGMLHDIGKVGVPWDILNKPGRLTDEEFEIIKVHSPRGAEMVARLDRFRDIGPIIRSHHERYDGKGYPDGLKGEDILWEARIISAADAFHAMASRRSYKDARDREYIKAEFLRGSGGQFDPRIAQAMLELLDTEELSDAGGW
ncbi:HD domain-containing phosphohydrolase [Fretibacterium sp. OH1220_COT-178]|uniref:HD domain-containing phosphohydrolase n=1 Tax=Fretibacterium sp. OH1220_COT-178 TaxID=2491047 RepID=UPI000F5F85A8|nr:HD domain-containing phosphohydrolase [Fretibacterium sp. OH1220_COT-178]RRD65661.1 HD domain-containing protein [Fretibacterium sp. OH1220_COT-178]